MKLTQPLYKKGMTLSWLDSCRIINDCFLENFGVIQTCDSLEGNKLEVIAKTLQNNQKTQKKLNLCMLNKDKHHFLQTLMSAKMNPMNSLSCGISRFSVWFSQNPILRGQSVRGTF